MRERLKEMPPSGERGVEDLGTPSACVADFCLIPVGSPPFPPLLSPHLYLDWHAVSLRFAGSRFGAAIDAEEQSHILDAFSWDYSWYVYVRGDAAFMICGWRDEAEADRRTCRGILGCGDEGDWSGALHVA